jgi:prevent-host-death family protein
MSTLDVFTVRDLRERTGELIRDAEEGRLSLVTKHGRPTLLALPFDERLLSHGVHRSLALKFTRSYASAAACRVRLPRSGRLPKAG